MKINVLQYFYQNTQMIIRHWLWITLILSLATLLTLTADPCSTGESGYYINTDSEDQFCDICHSSCKQCYGSLETNCISCSDRFNFVAANSTCAAPDNSTDEVLVKAYTFPGFGKLSDWTVTGFNAQKYQCGTVTLLGGIKNVNNRAISVAVSTIPKHFEIRVKANYYFLNANGTTKQAIISIGSNSKTSDASLNTILDTHKCFNTTVNYIYESVDVSIPHEGDSATIVFSATSGVSFGIRDVYIVAKKCHSDCKKCGGYENDQCKFCPTSDTTCRSCTDPNKQLFPVNPNTSDLTYVSQCKCTGTNGDYFKEPQSGQCIKPCPSVPIKLYGDDNTRDCIESCTNGEYAYDETFRCVDTCPQTYTSDTNIKVYHDQTNHKCVLNCPATEPYANVGTTRNQCYAYKSCPSGRLSCNATTMTCVDKCPQSTTHKLFAYDGACIPYCPDGTWANPESAKCQTTCNTSTAYDYMDNSTGLNLCVASCPAPNRFKHYTNNYCVQICPQPSFGDLSDQICKAKCSDTDQYGMISYNRKCVTKCPSGTWAEPIDQVCVPTTEQCDPRYDISSTSYANSYTRSCDSTNTTTQCPQKYANSYLRKCVIATDCQFGTFADPDTSSCVTYCPEGRFGHPTSRVCQETCESPYFADDGNNMCVEDCVTADTYATEDAPGSTRVCVTQCNQTGTDTPWADPVLKTCVADCNQSIASFVSDNTTWMCAYQCPDPYLADRSTVVPKCVLVCPTNYYADYSTGTGLCVTKCPTNPPLFGDADAGNLCVEVCSPGTFGDETGNRLCTESCPTPYFSQDDDIRRCVKRCNSSSFGYEEDCTDAGCIYNYKRVCYEDPHSCPDDYFGDNSTNLCVNPCPESEATFGDPLTKFCIRECLDNPNATALDQPDTYYADPSIRQCVLTCNETHSTPLFGNNNTRTCVPKCLDADSYAQTNTDHRLCVARCLESPTFHYANTQTKVCGPALSCPVGFYGLSSTQMCVETCPLDVVNWAHKSSKQCVDLCPSPQYGDNSTSKFICVDQCPSVPDRYADTDATDRICVDICDSGEYGNPLNRQCTSQCPDNYFAHVPTNRCVPKCPQGFFGDVDQKKCWPTSVQCTSGYGDSYLRLCVDTCTGPEPVDTYGLKVVADNINDCVKVCSVGYSYADPTDSSVRVCMDQCPGTVDSLAAPNLYGDPDTKKCVQKCITPLTWADPHTRLCEETCSSNPPLFAQNFTMTCVAALDCPDAPDFPTRTFGDTTTRHCVSFCSNGEFGDPNTRNCVEQCPKNDTVSQNYYGDTSTGQYLCVAVCPKVPRLFGENDTNLCVDQCPGNSWGDQTGKRTCVPDCPIISNVIWYAQNEGKICVTVCKNDTWGLQSTQKCVETPAECGTLWADDSTHKCVVRCPQIAGLFGDPSTRRCVQRCPNNSYASNYDRTCVTECPQNNGVYDTYGNNETWVCEQYCQEPNTYADPQTINHYCVTECSQNPERSFADPSSKFCVSQCPTHPSLYGQLVTFTCVTECTGNTYANTHTRLCSQTCPPNQFKLRSPQRCVTKCPSDPNLYGDTDSGFCEETCTLATQYRDAITRTCVDTCPAQSPLQFNFTCVKLCPDGYYANSTLHCVSSCPSTTFGQNTTTLCQDQCDTGYAYDGLCVAMCPDGFYGEVDGTSRECVQDCINGIASDHNNLCISECLAGTFEEDGDCKSSCTPGTYADPVTHKCESSCSASQLYGDPNTDSCVEVCPVNWFRDSDYLCKDDCGSKKADNITLNCESTCSNGYWGYDSECIVECPGTFYGLESNRDCYDLSDLNNLSSDVANLFADNTTKTWVVTCPQNPLLFGDTHVWQCVQACTNIDQYADPYSRKCETGCTNSSYFRDPETKFCVLVCPENYYGNSVKYLCELDCTNGLYNYQPTHMCVETCPRPYYGFENTTTGIRTCVNQCPDTYFAQGDLCETSCTLPLYADSTTHRCVQNCIDSFAKDDIPSNTGVCVTDCATLNADNSTNKCVETCPDDPDYYKQGNVCVMHCQIAGNFADPTTDFRQCTSECTQGLFGEPVSGRCVQVCLPGYYADDDKNLCVKTCQTGFADNSTGTCASGCPAPTFADSLQNKCVRICSGSQFGEGRVCVSKCTDNSYGNPLTRQCQPSCPDFDYTFAEDTDNLCVKNCIKTDYYADRNNNKCVQNCSLANQYMLDVVGGNICTSLCPEGLFMDNSTQRCQPTCDDGFAEPTTRYCVKDCFDDPQTFAYIDDSICVYECKSLGLYADNTTNTCVEYDNCNITEGYYSDPVSGYCVLFCPQGYFAEDTTHTCTTSCNDVDGFADNVTRKCVPKCPRKTQIVEDLEYQTFGETLDNLCVEVCPDQWFANQDSQQCVRSIDCPADTWADNMSKHCVSRCPSQPLFFGLNSTQQCIPQCPDVPDVPIALFGDYITQTCIPECYDDENGEWRFADPITRTCVLVCPIEADLYGDINVDPWACRTTCSNGWMRDNSTQRCVEECPSDPDYFADKTDPLDYVCVRFCPTGTFSSVDAGRECVGENICGSYSKFGDPTTNQCVDTCPQPYYADINTDMCVLKCETDGFYADNLTRSCVDECPWDEIDDTWRTFADTVNKICVTRCPADYLAVNSSRQCQTSCVNDNITSYADWSIQVCVKDCTVKPGLYKQTNNLTCVRECPDGTGSYVKAFKHEQNHTCIQTSGLNSGCPDPYYANPVNNYCTQICPHNYYADENIRYCVLACNSNQFADPVDRKCKTSCTTAPNSYALIATENKCVEYCPDPYFSQNKTWTCTDSCPIMDTGQKLYKYEPTRQCVLFCPPPYYAHDGNQTCLLGCPDGEYAQDETRTCDSGCTGNYFADPSSNRCVQLCPESPELYGFNNVCQQSCSGIYFKDNSTRLCVQKCPLQPLLFADDSTNTCVQKCPDDPDYFADNSTQTCVPLCSKGTFAQGTTRTCVPHCPDDLDTYAYEDQAETIRNCQAFCPDPFFASDITKQCVQDCPDTPHYTYAYIDDTQTNYRKCVQKCPDGLFGNNETLTCEPDCQSLADSWEDQTSNLCVTTCPLGFFAYNDTSKCLRQCPTLFADPTTRRCVANCPGTERLFADPSTNECVQQCPVGSYGSTQTWTCISACQGVLHSGTIVYELQIAKLCVEQCPSPYFAKVSELKCVTNCGVGLYGDSVSRECKTCPEECSTCLSLKNCLTCDLNAVNPLYLEYGRCVQNCTITDYLANYANDVAMMCVAATKCQSGTYGLNSTGRCQSSCPIQMYANVTTRRCQNCPQTCRECSSLLKCSVCNEFAEYSESDQFCFGHCNQTHQYKYQTECYTQCPERTYSDYTNVRCEKCNDICFTCQGNGLNCTACEGTFRLNNTCLTQCPSGYYSDSKQCLQCTPDVPSCSEPLSYTTTNYVQNYKQVVVMKFNQKAIIDGDPSQFIKVRIKAKRLLLESTNNLVNDGVNFKAEVLPNGQIKLYLDLQVTLQNPKFQVIFTDASKITTKYGGIIQTLQPQNYGTPKTPQSLVKKQVPQIFEPLSYITSSYVQNYQQVLVLKFSQPILVNGDPSKLIVVRRKQNRLLQSDISDLVNNGIEFQAVVLSDGTIKLILEPGVSLEDVNYEVVVTDANKITTESGATLQTLQSQIEMEASEIQVYQAEDLEQSPLVPVATILSIVILIITFFNMVIGSFPTYMAIEAVQITSFFAYCKTLPPNLYYFLKQLRITRFVFMPNIFEGVYVQPDTFVETIPQRVVDTEGQLSFSVNGTTFFLFIFLYLIIFLVVFILSSKFNSNRPLKNLFTKIYETRVKFGILQDFIWLFGLNILIHGALQIYYTQNGGDVGFGVVMMVAVLSLMFGLFGFGLKKFNAEQNQEKQIKPQEVNYEDYKGFEDNYYMMTQGAKDEKRHAFFFFAFYLRKILFVVFMAATMFESEIQASLLLALFVCMIFAIIIIRPYAQHTRNFITLVNEGFMGFLCGGIIFFHKMIELKEPSGAKITCGEVLSIVIIAHLSLLIIYSIYRTYMYVKHLNEQMKKAEFYRLYLDEEYDESLQKQISELGGGEEGEVESIQITNVGNQNENDEQDEGEQIIKLKIKRKVKKTKLKDLKEKEGQQSKSNNYRKAKDYLPINNQEERYYEMKPKDSQYEKLEIDSTQNENKNLKNKEKVTDNRDSDWVQMKQMNNYVDESEKIEEQIVNQGTEEYEQVKEGEKVIGNIFEQLQLQSQNLENEGLQVQQQVESQHKGENEEQNLQNNQHNDLTASGKAKFERNISSRQDFDEENFFPDQNLPKEEEQQNEQEDQGLAEQQKEDSYGEFEKFSEPEENLNEAQRPEENLEEKQSSEEESPNKEYDAFNMDELLSEEKPQEDMIFQQKKEMKQENKVKKKADNWSVNIEDLLDEGEDKMDEQKLKQKQKSKKMHMMLFDDQQFD